VVIVDSTVWVDFLAGRVNAQTAWLKREIPEQPIGLIDLILCEVLQGVRTDAQFRRVRRDLTEFDVFDSGGVALAVASAENYRNLRARGFTIRKTIDCLIATFCIEEGHALLHHDRDFDPFEEHLGLRVIHPQPLQS
jgi:predicted nucleic acid-binding protein